ncbi:MAG TPA: GNAT family N-acetyltransferase [Rubricoccaceae bacterium]
MTRPAAGGEAVAVETAPLADAAVRDAYASLWAESPQRTVFAGLAFADAACAVFGLTGRLALGRDAAGQVAIGAVLFEKRTGPLRQIVVPPLTPYTGPIFARDVGIESSDIVRAFLAAVTEGAASVAFHLPPAVSDVRPFLWAGFDAAPRYTYWGASGLATAPPYVRKMVRENGPVRVDGSSREAGTVTYADPSAATDVVRAMERAFARRGEPMPVDDAQAEHLVRALAEAGIARIVVAETRGTRVGAVATLTDGQTGHFWAGAGDPGPAMLLLMATTTEALAAEGVPTFDLVGANMERISTFKQRFGLPLVVHYRVAWTGARVLRLRNALRAA